MELYNEAVKFCNTRLVEVGFDLVKSTRLTCYVKF